MLFQNHLDSAPIHGNLETTRDRIPAQWRGEFGSCANGEIVDYCVGRTNMCCGAWVPFFILLPVAISATWRTRKSCEPFLGISYLVTPMDNWMECHQRSSGTVLHVPLVPSPEFTEKVLFTLKDLLMPD